VEEIARGLPSEQAVAALSELGFRSILIRHPAAQELPARLRERFSEFDASPAGEALTLVLASGEMTLYDIAADE